jgi:hypothetical protein
MLEAKMIFKKKDKISTEQFYLGNFGMEALQRPTTPDINNRPNNFLRSITLRTENGLQLINERAEKIIATKKRNSLAPNGNQLTNDRAATKKRDSLAKTSTKITPQQKQKKMKLTPATDCAKDTIASSSSTTASKSSEDDDKDEDKDKKKKKTTTNQAHHPHPNTNPHPQQTTKTTKTKTKTKTMKMTMAMTMTTTTTTTMTSITTQASNQKMKRRWPYCNCLNRIKYNI